MAPAELLALEVVANEATVHCCRGWVEGGRLGSVGGCQWERRHLLLFLI